MSHFDFKTMQQVAESAQRHGQKVDPVLIIKCLARIYQLEKELQDARQLKLFGDVKPPPKTPIGV